jgi:tetratricopeptide (TPR) repeat protein
MTCLETPVLHDRLLQIAYFQEDMEEVRKQEDWLRQRSAEHLGAQRAAEWNSAHGRFRKAEDWLTVWRSALSRDRPGAIAQFSSLSAIQDALIGDCRSIRPAVSDALARNRERELIGPAGVALALCGESAQVDRLAAEVQSGWPQGTIANIVDVPSIRAAVALHAGKPEAAVAGLQGAAPYERTYPIPSYLRGLAYLRMKSGTAAAAEFQKVIERRVGFVRAPPRNLYCAGRVWAAAYLGLGRAQAMAGNAAEARKTYEKFLDLWKDADPGIPLLAEARKEYAALTWEKYMVCSWCMDCV